MRHWFVKVTRMKWLPYLLIVALVIMGIIICFWFVQLRNIQKVSDLTPAKNTKQTVTASPAEQAQRLSVMNILNTFVANHTMTATSNDTHADTAIKNIDETTSQLKALSVSESLVPAKDDLIKLFTEWSALAKAHKNTDELKNHFAAMGSHYPWLETLIWIIILNRF